MGRSITPSVIVLEVLREDNYANWRACMKNYLLAQGLWDFVEKASKDLDDLKWRKKNAATLHAIQISCSHDVLTHIREETWAKAAWDKLAETYHPVKPIITSNRIIGTGSNNSSLYDAFLDARKPGDCNNADDFLQHLCQQFSDNIDDEDFLQRYPFSDNAKDLPRLLRQPFSANVASIALRQAMAAGDVPFVTAFVQLIPDSFLETANPLGVRALHSAAMTGNTRLAKCLVDKNERVLHFEAANGMIPVTLASCLCNPDMTRYLYSVTPLGDLTANEGLHGATLLSHCIAAKIFDVALHLLQRSPRLAFCRDKDGITPVYALAQIPSAFRSGAKLGCLRRWIYDCIQIRPLQLSTETPINIQKDYNDQTNDRNLSRPGPSLLVRSVSNVLYIPVRLVSYLLHIPIRVVSYLLDVVKQLHEMKLIHTQATQLLDFMFQDIKKFGSSPFVDEAFLQAASNGIVEFFNTAIKANPDVLWSHDINHRNLLMLAVQHRQEKIFNLICGFEREKNALASYTDSFGNNILHFAGCLAPSTQLQQIPGAALQMQWELQWFKDVENIVHPKCKEARSVEGFTPRELFTEKHKNLKKEGEEWMKETATSSTVVGALIMTITFAAIFTVPVGNDQTTGFPIFLHHKLFLVFIIFDALSLVSSSASVFTFLGILTSRYAEDDFLKSLPIKLVIGILTLFFSILTMMVAFCTALDVMNKGKLWAVAATPLLAGFPVLISYSSQFGLIIEMLRYTFGSSISDKKTKRRLQRVHWS